jgi:cell division septation protein DedD
LARKKKRKSKVLGGVITLLRYVLIAVTAVMLGYGAGQLVIQVIAARLGSPPVVQTEGDSRTGALEQTAVSGAVASTAVTSTGTTDISGASDASGATESDSQPVGSPVPTPTSAVPHPTDKPQSPQTAAPEAVPAVATPKPLPEETQPNTAANPIVGELWRVRLGRFATREEAEAALAQVREFVPQAYVIFADQYQIQAGAFSERSRAVAFLNELGDLHLSAEIVSSAP